MIVILMGVTGSGKSTVGRALAEATGWVFADGDDYHSQANREKMHAGIPLTDEDRAPWLESLHRLIANWAQSGVNAILACSALKESYRQTLTAGVPQALVHFINLSAPPKLILQRLEARKGHFMPPALLPSQLATLEIPPEADEVSVVPPVPEIVAHIRRLLQA